MKRFLAICFFFSVSLPVFAQSMQLVTSLSAQLSETSGMVIVEGKLYTHSDSGNDAAIYEVDTLTGDIVRTISIDGATNTDWEDLQVSGDYIYIGDIGNNAGNRTDLRFYRILLSDLTELVDNTATAEDMPYFYGDQTDFTSQPFATQYDAEAFVVVNEEIFIFTKNWNNEETNVYQISSFVGEQEAILIGGFNSEGLITGAWYDPIQNNARLVGYTLILQPFTISIIIDIGFYNGIFNPIRTSVVVPSTYSSQIESITSTGDGHFLVASEESPFSQPAGIYSFEQDVLGTNTQEVLVGKIYPNPANGLVQLDVKGFYRAEIYDSLGRVIYRVTQPYFDVSDWTRGVYFIKVFLINQKVVYSSQIVVE